MERPVSRFRGWFLSVGMSATSTGCQRPGYYKNDIMCWRLCHIKTSDDDVRKLQMVKAEAASG
jgi:hypothetical protein